MVILFFITLGMQMFLQRSFDREYSSYSQCCLKKWRLILFASLAVTHYLPMSLASRRTAKRLEMIKKKEEGLAVESEVDLFSRHRTWILTTSFPPFPFVDRWSLA